LSHWRDISLNGLWKNNPALVQVLGLCPLLAVSNSAVNGLGLGLATLLVLTLSNITVATTRRFIPQAARIPCYVLLIASVTTCVQLLMNAYTYSLYQVLGIFIPLIVTNCVIMGRAESFAVRNPILDAFWDGLMNGLGFCLVLFILGSGREIIGTGIWMAGAEQLFGESGKDFTVEFMHLDNTFLLAILPPGAFIGLGLMIAGKNAIDAYQKTQKTKIIGSLK
jgi:electron transport complex protein RnfE